MLLRYLYINYMKIQKRNFKIIPIQSEKRAFFEYTIHPFRLLTLLTHSLAHSFARPLLIRGRLSIHYNNIICTQVHYSRSELIVFIIVGSGLVMPMVTPHWIWSNGLMADWCITACYSFSGVCPPVMAISLAVLEEEQILSVPGHHHFNYNNSRQEPHNI